MLSIRSNEGIETKTRNLSKWQNFQSEAMPSVPELNRVALWLTKNKSDAEDLVQETLLQALKSFHQYRLGTNCRAWLTTIMYNLNAKRLQKIARFKFVDDPEGKLTAAIPAFPSISPEITDASLMTGLQNLPESFRQVLILSDVQDFSYKEISSTLKIPLGTVMSRLSRGRSILRQQLSGFAAN